MAQNLAEYLSERAAPEIGAAILALSNAAADVATRLARLNAGAEVESEAHAVFGARLAGTGVRFLASDLESGIAGMAPGGDLAIALCPFDGADASPGTLFSIYPAAAVGTASFLRPGTEQIAAGIFLYGPATTLALSTGKGTALFFLDRDSATYRCHTPELRLANRAREFAANAADYRDWEAPVQRFADDSLFNVDGPNAGAVQMRWTGSVVAEAQRILTRGGLYLAPRGPRGALRLVHHCHPIALLAEQAGGRATDGRERILGQSADTLDATSPLVFGAPDDVARVAAYHDLPDAEASPLFSRRGLFRL